MYIHVRGIS